MEAPPAPSRWDVSSNPRQQYGHKWKNELDMKKILIIITAGLFFATCTNNSYEIEEAKAIQDIANNFLQRNLLTEEEVVRLDGEVIKFKPFIDSLNSRVYFSNALLPISQVKEDNEWMFNDNYFGTPDSAIFYGIINLKRFDELTYRKFDKSKIELIEPFKQFNKSQEKKIADEEYTIFEFSRVCFDDKRENGVLVINYLKGYESGKMNGYNMALLIKKENGKWVYIPRK